MIQIKSCMSSVQLITANGWHPCTVNDGNKLLIRTYVSNPSFRKFKLIQCTTHKCCSYTHMQVFCKERNALELFYSIKNRIICTFIIIINKCQESDLA